MPLLFIDKCLDTVSYVLLQVVVEEAVIVQVIRLRTEQVYGIGRDGVSSLTAARVISRASSMLMVPSSSNSICRIRISINCCAQRRIAAVLAKSGRISRNRS